MVIDSSALISILRNEAEAPVLARAIRAAPVRRISAATFVETGIVVDVKFDAVASRRLDELLAAMNARFEPFTAEQARLARGAYRDFGRGSGHPARLNLGDCFAYALAVSLNEPLLFTGTDFALTGVRSATDPA